MLCSLTQWLAWDGRDLGSEMCVSFQSILQLPVAEMRNPDYNIDTVGVNKRAVIFV